MRKFRKRLREAIEESGLTPQYIENELGVEHATVVLWLAGKRRPSIEHLSFICSLLDVSADYLLGLSDQPE